ncbi:glycosyltransferase family 1 protein [Desulfobacter hydrogenophilus]|uniref:Glycosyltransferase family 1 protein n=1 Tax=Desulfobacter hydrogenophilus TaxID=2291 RepID=A0A328F9B2_9BACT|nr:glycosyltransferase family 4 protein [Desulfobacter hydrogenophilus]NDY73224.1 glycosyltransferase family 4 protein [Desulfobacter hydrogenophilus]QBH13802.1 glycosyltransferase family 1 protein [Desulfobacter hydrogenophilus]RAM00816.1 glycosyltransferase family 1 protein [Desulfobacter hydrogenophilus]
MKIAILVKRFTLSGGKERYVVELIQALCRRGHHVDVFACEAEPQLLNGIGFFPVPNRMRFSSVLNTISFVRETAKILKNHNYDIIHSHERNYTQEVLTLHSFSYYEGLEKYTLFRKIDQKYLSLRSLLYLWLERRQMKTPWLISVSTAISKDVEKNYHRTGNIVEIPPGVDLTVFDGSSIHAIREQARKEKAIEENELAVLFVGSAFQRKGLDRLIPAITEEMRLLVVGKGDHIPKFKKMIKAHDCGQRISMEGITDNIIKYYALADVVVLPSRSEAFGMSILEGMACGLPVIVSHNSGIADLIRHGENGFLMNKASELPGLLELMRSGEKRREIGLRARKTAEQYGWSRVGASHEALYEKILSKKKSKK